MSKTDYDSVIKFLVIGDSGVGKTCVLLRFTDDSFNNVHLATIGIDFKLKTMEIQGKKVKLQIWDTAGQERFKTITQNYYKGASGIVLCYSVTDRDSFNNIQNWMKQINEHADEKVCKMLIGNKKDLQDRVITPEEGLNLAKEHNIPFFETSAKDGTNVQQAFQTITEAAYNQLQSSTQSMNPGSNGQNLYTVNQQNQKKKKDSGCC